MSQPLEGKVIPSVHPLTHSHQWGDWSTWTDVPGTNYQYRMHACLAPGCLTIVMDHQPIDMDAASERSLEDYDETFIGSDARCNDKLDEADWIEGYTCSLPAGHHGPHRQHTDEQGNLIGTHENGRRYRWAYEWMYESH